jgi:hypothetical protein
MLRRTYFLTLVLIGFVSLPAPAQTTGTGTTDTGTVTTVTHDPQALAVANKALQVLAPMMALTDITLQGTMSRTAGSDYQGGTFSFQASGNGKSLEDANLDGGPRQQVRNGPAGYWTDSEGQQHPLAIHNCWTDAPWFFPGLSQQGLASDPQVSIFYVGLESRDGVALHHLRLFRTLPDQKPTMTTLIQRLSTIDLYLDSASYLPLIVALQTHPDDDLNIDIPVEIQFGDYRLVNGANVQFHIQKFLQRTFLLDITLSSAVADSGLSESLFAFQVQ